jgi:hypothetical protein
MVIQRGDGAPDATGDGTLERLLDALRDAAGEVQLSEAAADRARDRVATLVFALRRRGCPTGRIARAEALGRGHTLTAWQLRSAYDRLRRRAERQIRVCR